AIRRVSATVLPRLEHYSAERRMSSNALDVSRLHAFLAHRDRTQLADLWLTRDGLTPHRRRSSVKITKHLNDGALKQLSHSARPMNLSQFPSFLSNIVHQNDIR